MSIIKFNKLHITLLISLISIWGVILSKIFASNGNKIPVPINSKIEPRAITTISDSFFLNLNYPDPFLENEISDTQTLVNLNSQKPIQKISPIIKEGLNFIQYHGMIYNKKAKIKIGLINFKGTDKMIKEKDKFENITFTKISENALVAYAEGKAFTILRTE